jgi:hypothetical protein
MSSTCWGGIYSICSFISTTIDTAVGAVISTMARRAAHPPPYHFVSSDWALARHGFLSLSCLEGSCNGDGAGRSGSGTHSTAASHNARADDSDRSFGARNQCRR